MIQLVAIVLAFWLGYSVNRSGTCVVSAAHELVQHRRPGRTLGLLIASAAAGLTALPLVWSASAGATLVPSTDVSLALLAGAVAFGIGALTNDACLLGSLGRLGNGESRLLALPPGLATGFVLVSGLRLPAPPSQPSLLGAPDVAGLGALGGFLVALALLVSLLQRSRIMWNGSGSLLRNMILVGVSGGAIYALVPAWTYPDFLLASLSPERDRQPSSALATVLAAVAGAIASAYRHRTWRARGASFQQLVRTFAAGVLMGAGAALIPGGNDSLAFAAIPALSVGGITAYVVMFSVIVLLLSGLRSRSTRRRQAG